MATIIFIWLLGSFLAYPRMVASFYEIDEKYLDYPALKPNNTLGEAIASLCFSWVLVISGIMIYYDKNERYFWKWSKGDLWDKYNNNKIN